VDVRGERPIDDPDRLEPSVVDVHLFEHARAAAEQHGHHVDLQFVDETGRDVRASDLGAAHDDHVLVTRDALGLLQR
jgi:hypothetical protein